MNILCNGIERRLERFLLFLGICFMLTVVLFFSTSVTIAFAAESVSQEVCIEQENNIEGKEQETVLLTGGVANVLSGKKVVSTTHDEENQVLVIKTEQGGAVVSEIHVDTITAETTIVKMEDNNKIKKSTETENGTKENDLDVIIQESIDLDVIIQESIDNGNKLIIYEELLAKIPDRLRIPSDGTFISAFGPSSKQIRSANENEIILLAKLIQAEARWEPHEGKVVVAATVLNRREEDPVFGKTIEEIIMKYRQFASINNIDEVDPECLQAAKDAVNGYDPSRILFPNGLLYFNQPGCVDDRPDVVLKLRIGGHDCARDYGK